ncbi:MAG: VWA-like domain-containing protein [Sulfurimonas sp.]|nr:VWA-like domain-containing protein [Sulfurimonas sp.]
MQIEFKISKAKAKLLVDYPLFGTIASKLELVLNNDIQSFNSNGIKLEYSSDFFQRLTLSQMEFVFANGAMHASLAYKSRKNNRSGWLWQLATDYAINDMLVENGMDKPDEAYYSKRFSGLYAEEIYAELKADINLDSFNESSQSSEVNGLEESSVCNLTDKKLIDEVKQIQLTKESKNLNLQDEQLFEEFAKATFQAEIKGGEIIQGIDRFFTLNYDGKIDWRDELKIAIDKFHKDDYILMPPNKKFLHLGIYLPSCKTQRFKLVIAVDSSSSIDEELLNLFLSELNFLMNTIANYQIELLICDDKIQSHKTFYSGDILEVDLKGAGATDFRPVFEFIEDELSDIKLLLYFTDLDGIFPKVNPNYDVKWICLKETSVPFGELIILKN